MGDSDEEYDRRRRDKFRGERNDYDNRRPPPRGYDRGRGSDRRGGHENSWENRGSKRDYYGRDQGNRDRRESFGRGSSPPSKKPRGRDWYVVYIDAECAFMDNLCSLSDCCS